MQPTPDPASPGLDLSLLGLFLEADPIVKGVMIFLLLASVAVWAVVIEKLVTVGRLRRDARNLEAAIEGGGVATTGLPAAILAAADQEWRDRSDRGESRGEARTRIERAMRQVAASRLRAAEPGLPTLATIGSAAPFIGLFGTVWGIMNSFTAIAGANDTSLAVVAPGIAEALFATAVGLAAAIPAVMAYNKLAVDLGRIAARLNAAIAIHAGRLSRHAAVDLRRQGEAA